MNKFAISLKRRYIDAFLSGKKTVEVRTRLPKALTIGDELIVVETMTDGSVPLILEVFDIDISGWYDGWNLYRNEIFLSQREYIDYVNGRSIMCFVKCRVKETCIPVKNMREWGLKHAPQWFARISEK